MPEMSSKNFWSEKKKPGRERDLYSQIKVTSELWAEKLSWIESSGERTVKISLCINVLKPTGYVIHQPV